MRTLRRTSSKVMPVLESLETRVVPAFMDPGVAQFLGRLGLQFQPSPFCVLDELDAPLDESNINRFIKVLDRFVGQSQFIIITHNKRTIAKADILYGVTMEERGVSKLVGMRLTKAQAAVENAPSEEAVTPQQRSLRLEEAAAALFSRFRSVQPGPRGFPLS